MGDLRKTTLSKLGLSTFWHNIWYLTNNIFGPEVLKIKLYLEVFQYIFFWGFSFSPLFFLKSLNIFLENNSFNNLNKESYFRSKKKFSRLSKGNLLVKVSSLNYHNFTALIFYIYIPTKDKKSKKSRKIFRQKMFNQSILSNFKAIVQINTLGVISLINKNIFFKFNYLNLRKSFDIFILIQNRYFYFFVNLLKFNSFFYNNLLLEITGFESIKSINNKDNINSRVINTVYIFYLNTLNIQLFCSVLLSPSSQVQTIAPLYHNANWAEREFGEMFGIAFKGKKDSRKLLLDYSFVGFPLLKSFSLTGYFELYFNLNLFWIFYTPIKYKHGYEFYTFYNY